MKSVMTADDVVAITIVTATGNVLTISNVTFVSNHIQVEWFTKRFVKKVSLAKSIGIFLIGIGASTGLMEKLDLDENSQITIKEAVANPTILVPFHKINISLTEESTH
jgi:hypothetical protein